MHQVFANLKLWFVGGTLSLNLPMKRFELISKQMFWLNLILLILLMPKFLQGEILTSKNKKTCPERIRIGVKWEGENIVVSMRPEFVDRTYKDYPMIYFGPVPGRVQISLAIGYPMYNKNTKNAFAFLCLGKIQWGSPLLDTVITRYSYKQTRATDEEIGYGVIDGAGVWRSYNKQGQVINPLTSRAFFKLSLSREMRDSLNWSCDSINRAKVDEVGGRALVESVLGQENHSMDHHIYVIFKFAPYAKKGVDFSSVDFYSRGEILEDDAEIFLYEARR